MPSISSVRPGPAAAAVPAARWSPLRVLLIAVLGLFLVLAAYVHRDGVTAVDAAVDALLGPWRSASLRAWFSSITILGSGTAVVAAAALGSVVLWLQRRKRLIVVLWWVLAGSGLSTWVAKLLVARQRPGWMDAVHAASPSFPSSHAAAAMACYAFLAYACARHPAPGAARRLIVATAVTAIALVAFSRVFLGLHHVTDVAGGVLLSSAWVLGGVLAARRD